MSSSVAKIPATCKALVQGDNDIVLKEVPVPELGENEVLIRVKAIGINPGDVRAPQMYPAKGSFAGSDLSGVVVKLGPNLQKDIKIGDVVGASIVGNVTSGRGAFAEYAKAYSDLIWKVPEGSFTFEEVAATGIPLNTAFQVLFGSQTLNLVQPFSPFPPRGRAWIFIYGGSSCVGLYVVQLAKLSGYKIAAAASPRNHELLKCYGADVLLDYRDPEMAQKIKAATGDKIHMAIDTICKKGTQFTAMKVLAEGVPGKLVVLLPPEDGLSNIRNDVEVKFMVIFTAYGFEFKPFGLDDDNRQELSAFLQKLTGMVKDGRLDSIPIRKLGSGLENVYSEGYQHLREGKASAEKVVFSL